MPPARSSPRCLPLPLHEVPVSVRRGTLSRRGRVWYWRGRGCCGTVSWRRRDWCQRGRGEDPERYELRCEEGRRRCAVGGAGAQSCACRFRWRARRWWARRSARRCQQRSRHQPRVRRPYVVHAEAAVLTCRCCCCDALSGGCPALCAQPACRAHPTGLLSSGAPASGVSPLTALHAAIPMLSRLRLLHFFPRQACVTASGVDSVDHLLPPPGRKATHA